MSESNMIFLAADIEVTNDTRESGAGTAIITSAVGMEANIMLRLFNPDDSMVYVYEFAKAPSAGGALLYRVSRQKPTPDDLRYMEETKDAHVVNIEGRAKP
jgi:hypothetical protein